MRIIKVKKNQSLADIALQEYGDIEGVFHLVNDNPELNGITDNVFENDELNIRDEVINQQVKRFLEPTVISTAEDARGQGIGYMRIETDNIVS